MKALGTAGFIVEIIGMGVLVWAPDPHWGFYLFAAAWFFVDGLAIVIRANHVRGSPDRSYLPDLPYILMIVMYVAAVATHNPLLFIFAGFTHLGRDVWVLWGEELKSLMSRLDSFVLSIPQLKLNRALRLSASALALTMAGCGGKGLDADPLFFGFA